jgi:hypothetical protein
MLGRAALIAGTCLTLTACSPKENAPDEATTPSNSPESSLNDGKELSGDVEFIEEENWLDSLVNKIQSIGDDGALAGDVVMVEPTIDISETTPEIEDDTEKHSDISELSYDLTVNGHNITLPCSYSEFKEITHLEINNEDNTYHPGEYTSCVLYDGEEDRAVGEITIMNDSETEDLKGAECKVIGILHSINSGWYPQHGLISIDFPNETNVYKWHTMEEIVELFGEPDYIGEAFGEGEVYYYYDGEEKDNYISFEFVDSTIQKIRMQRLKY